MQNSANSTSLSDGNAERLSSRISGSMNTRRKALKDGTGPHSWMQSILQDHIQKANSSYEQFAKSQLARARKQQGRQLTRSQITSNPTSNAVNEQLSIKLAEDVSPFAKPSPSVRPNSISTKGGTFCFHGHDPDSRPSSFVQQVEFVRFHDSGPSVPPHTHHVQLQRNIVTENNKKLNFNPNEIQFEDPQWSLQEYEDELKEQFTDGLLDQRAKPLKYTETSKYLRPFILRALHELDCPVENILRYILDPLPESSAKRRQRDLANEDGFGPLSDEIRWAVVLSKLPVSTKDEQELAGAVCEAFENLMKFSIWYLVKHEASISSRVPAYLTQPSGMCRICFRFACTAHGEFCEEFENVAAKTGNFAFGSSDINYRTNIALDDQEHRIDKSNEGDFEVAGAPKSYQYWRKNLQIFANLDQESPVNYARGHFYPCNHEGRCDTNQCPCYRDGVNCEKFCYCPEVCERRFPGCNCSYRGLTCTQERCLCRRMDRECDPDVCIKCGAAEALTVQEENQEESIAMQCSNVGIQRGIPKRMLLGTSQVSGFGLFMGEKAKSGDFLAEYKGELISKDEAGRRQILHQYLREYLFELNKDQQIDSLYAGNKLRFVNNANSSENINCDPLPMLCNGTIRMGLFATRDLQPGDELFFKYGYTEGQMIGFKEPTNKKGPLPKSAGQLERKLKRTIDDVYEAKEIKGKAVVAAVSSLRSSAKDRRIIEDSDASHEDTLSESDQSQLI